ncbi:MAG TPA: 4a-hydroxytetrahydrobiopterin dehydratase [Mycobacteriales bacterium]|nr:4a-hydroxytetrahydrobiopterin dehydratase [Mycobacteriales bacterium]HWH29966.1 4a-hydroxytetrahydrobiopterin dehydratase [Mycobacteriales bacterium]
MQTISKVPDQRPRYTALTPDELAAALRDLPEWHGDTRRIARTVTPTDLWSLLERVAAAEAELDHHTVVDLDSGTVTFSLWTHVRDAVTEADIALAHRLDAVIGAGLDAG